MTEPPPSNINPVELTPEDVRRITQAILGLVSVGEKITLECFDRDLPAESVAQRLFASEERQYALEALLTIQYANLSGFDHARGFVALTRTPTVRSTALVTVARGALESFARSWHLLRRTDDLDMIYRVISLLFSDLQYPAKHHESTRTRNGADVDPEAQRTAYKADLARLKLPGPAQTQLAAMVTAMLDDAFNDEISNLRYSALSAVAHAHRLAINLFVITDSIGKVARLASPHRVTSSSTSLCRSSPPSPD